MPTTIVQILPTHAGLPPPTAQAGLGTIAAQVGYPQALGDKIKRLQADVAKPLADVVPMPIGGGVQDWGWTDQDRAEAANSLRYAQQLFDLLKSRIGR